VAALTDAAPVAGALAAPGRLLLLGETVFVADNRRAPLRAERRFHLLVVLALKRAPVERDWLAALFWPERDNATARRNLRKLAFDVQELDWVQGIESERATLAWRIDTDVIAFERALDEGREADALQLYRGPLGARLEAPDNNAFNAWLRRERAALDERWRALVLRCLADPHRSHAGALELAQRLLAADPLDEEAVVAIMRAHEALGQAAFARRTYRTYKTRLAETLGIEPALRLRTLVAAIEAKASATCVPTPRAPDDSLIGRDNDLSELLMLLAREECRVLTISGPGGIGKSRLAKAAAARAEHLFPDGLWWVPLDDLDAVEKVAPRIAPLLGIDASAGEDATQAIETFLATRRTCLVLDNAEQIARIAQVVDRLVASAPALKVLVTSRRRLGATGEWLLPLAGLAVPPPATAPGELQRFDAVRLFEARALSAKPDFDAQTECANVADIVRALGGLPLAIELAADWVRLLPVAEIRSEVARSLDVLEREQEGDERAEHRSVRATFESSWRLLAPAEQEALAALAVFCGPLSHAAARTVAGASLPLLGSLADKSLLQPVAGGRFNLHPLIQQFAREKLALGGAAETVQRRHAEYFCGDATRYETWFASDQKQALALLAREHTDLLAAFRWALAHERAELVRSVASAFRYFYEINGRLDEGLEILAEVERLAAFDSRAALLARAEGAQARAALHYRGGRFEACANEGKSALKLSRAAGDAKSMRGAMTMIAAALGKLGDYTGSRRYSEQALRSAERAHDTEMVATSLNNLGLVESQRGFPEAAIPYLERTLAMTRMARDRTGTIAALNNLAVALMNAAQPAPALPYLEEGLALADDAGFLIQRSYFFSNLAQAAFELGDTPAARRWAEQGLDSVQAGSDRSSEPACRIVLGRIAQAEGRREHALHELRQAVRVASAMRLQRFMVRAAIACAGFHLANAAVDEAVRLLACINASGAANRIDLARTGRLLDDARAHLDEASFAAAKAQGESLTFDAMLARIGAETGVTIV
jgi:predicted ATPase/DNA-binding SARP family transcriptional activator